MCEGVLITVFTVCAMVISESESSILPHGATDNPVVHTVYGPIRGYTEPGINGRAYYAFKGIPYAKPPIGYLRFEPPQKPDNWTETLDVHHDPPYCMQKDYLLGHQLEGAEDCLYLNVYVPKYVRHSLPLPVMVFIHWGGFFAGYSTSDYLGPEYLLERRDVILVTMNYRLGVLGFLTTNDDNASGNYGLKDQLAALKWVQENIANFAGDKNKVTLFGQSAGGASVHYHMISPQSKNLFHRAISQSGSALALWAKPLGASQRTVAQIQGQFVGCVDTDDNAVLIECLRKVPADKLVEAGDLFKAFTVDPLSVYVPAIESKTEKNSEPFITKQPLEYIRAKEFMNVPWIIGSVQGEGLIRAEALVTQSNNREALTKNFDTLMPEILLFSVSTSNKTWFWDEMKKFYFGGKSGIYLNDSSTIKGLADIYTDRSFAYFSYQTALLHNMQGHNDIWYYNFNYTGQYSYGPPFSPGGEPVDYDWEACHCDDLIYLFTTPALFKQLSNPQDLALKTFMTDSFINFAETGDPNDHTSPTKWEKMNKNSTTFQKNIHYLDIEGDWKDPSSPRYQMKDHLHEERFQFLEKLPLAENIADLGQNHIDLTT